MSEDSKGMSLGWKVVGGVLIGALVLGPLGAIVGGGGVYWWNKKDTEVVVVEKQKE